MPGRASAPPRTPGIRATLPGCPGRCQSAWRYGRSTPFTTRPITSHLADVVSPPYDVIDDDLRRRLLDRSPYNVVHLILPEPGEEREAGDTLEAWRRENGSSCGSRGPACTGSSSTRAAPTACAAAAPG